METGRWRAIVEQSEGLIDEIERSGSPVPPQLRRDYDLAVQTVAENRAHLDQGELGFLPLIPILGWGIGIGATLVAGFTIGYVATAIAGPLVGAGRNVIAQAGRAVGVATYALVGLGVYWLARRMRVA